MSEEKIIDANFEEVKQQQMPGMPPIDQEVLRVKEEINKVLQANNMTLYAEVLVSPNGNFPRVTVMRIPPQPQGQADGPMPEMNIPNATPKQ